MTDEKKNEMIEKFDFLPPAEGGTIGGLDLVADRLQPAFLKIIQPPSTPPFKPPFEDGDVIVVPNMLKIIGQGESFHFVPLFTYPEYCIHNPIQEKSLPFIRERSCDPNSELAKRARSRNTDDREFQCPENKKLTCAYVEHLNFVIVLLDKNESIGDVPIVYSAFKSEWQRGMSFITLMKARKGAQHCCQCVFQASMSKQPRVNQYGRWYGLDITNPVEREPYLKDAELVKHLFSMSSSIEKAFKESGIEVNFDSAPESEDSEDQF